MHERVGGLRCAAYPSAGLANYPSCMSASAVCAARRAKLRRALRPVLRADKSALAKNNGQAAARLVKRAPRNGASVADAAPDLRDKARHPPSESTQNPACLKPALDLNASPAARPRTAYIALAEVRRHPAPIFQCAHSCRAAVTQELSAPGSRPAGKSHSPAPSTKRMRARRIRAL